MFSFKTLSRNSWMALDWRASFSLITKIHNLSDLIFIFFRCSCAHLISFFHLLSQEKRKEKKIINYIILLDSWFVRFLWSPSSGWFFHIFRCCYCWWWTDHNYMPPTLLWCHILQWKGMLSRSLSLLISIFFNWNWLKTQKFWYY